MKRLTCEVCGGTNIIKKDGVFECQDCGTKYSLEDAKKLLIEGKVDVSGSTVKIDNSDELNNLYVLARRARDESNSENAEKYYNLILVKNPDDWEASYYVVYFKALSSTLAGMSLAVDSVANCLPSVFQLIKKNVPQDKQTAIVEDLASRTVALAETFNMVAEKHYNEIDYQIRDKFRQEMIERNFANHNLLYSLGNLIETYFGDNKQLKGSIVSSWKLGIDMHKKIINKLQNRQSNVDVITEYINKIKKYDDKYEAPNLNQSEGCYIATCVYQSYDCPPVWTLRRFRDYKLARVWYGRLFIKFYYAVSPKIVTILGKKIWFRKLIKPELDSLVLNLKERGYKDTPYDDTKF